MKNIRVLLVDDHTVVRAGLRALINSQPGLEVVGEASDGFEALKKTQELSPDLAIVDLAMPGISGIELIRQMRKTLPSVKVLVLTMYAADEYIYQVLKAGAKGYVTKDAPADDLLKAITTVQDGHPFLSSTVSRKVINEYLRDRDGSKTGEASTVLTLRENEVLKLVSEGKSNKEIAASLTISVKTVEAHKAKIMEKLGTRNYSHLVKYAIKKGLVEEQGPIV